MRAAELQDPVGYDGPWALLAVLAIVVAAAYYVAVLWWTRDRAPDPPRRFARTASADSLTRLAEIERAVARGELSARVAHQQVSRVVREHVANTAGVPVTSMTLADLRRDGPEPLARVVALVYPPSFAGDDELARQRLPRALDQARELVTAWS